jgi:sulfur carrier protein ThiS
MKVRVRLYGTLCQRFSDYQPLQGINVEIPNGATVKDLLALLEISESRGAVIIVEGRILKADDELRFGVPVNVFQTIQGG